MINFVFLDLRLFADACIGRGEPRPPRQLQNAQRAAQSARHTLTARHVQTARQESARLAQRRWYEGLVRHGRCD